MVLESLYPTIEEALENRLHIYFGAVGPWLAPLLLAQLSLRLGVTPAQLHPIEHVPLLRCPVLVVHGTEDRHTTIQEAQRVFTAVPVPKEFKPDDWQERHHIWEITGKALDRDYGEF